MSRNNNLSESSAVMDRATCDLFDAVGRGDQAAVDSALAKGASLAAVNEKQNTPLMLAMINADRGIVDTLLKHGADPNQRVGDNLPPLVLAAKMHIPILYSLGNDQRAEDGREPEEPCIRLLAAAGADLKQQGPEAAMIAVINRAVSTLVALDEAGLDWAAVYSDTENPAPLIDLLFGLATQRPGMSDGVVEFCLKHGAQKNRVSCGQSPLVNVLRKMNLDEATFRRLLDAGVDFNTSDDHGMTPLMIAAALGHDEAFERLLEKGADPWRLDSEGRCAVHWAAAHNRANVLGRAVRLGLHQHVMPMARMDGEPTSLDGLAPSTCVALRVERTPGFFSPVVVAPDVAKVQVALSDRFGNYRSPQGPFLILCMLTPAVTPLRPTSPFVQVQPFCAHKGDAAVLVLSGVQTVQDLIYKPDPADFTPLPILAAVRVCSSVKEAQSILLSLPVRSFVGQVESILTLDEGFPIVQGSLRLRGGVIEIGP